MNGSLFGVFHSSITAATSDIGYQDKFWIMAPPGNDPAGNPCANSMKFNIPFVPSVEMEIVPPATPNPPAAPNPTATPDPATFTLGTSSPCVWRGVGADTTELAIVWKLGLAGPPAGSKQDVDLPIGVKLMKRRTVKVICYMVRMPGYSDSITTSGEAHLESTLNEIFGSQINAWFEVVVKSPTVYQVDYDVDNNLWMNATTSTGATAGDAAKIIADVPRDTTGNIHVYYTNFHVALSSTPRREPGEQGSAGVHASTPTGGNNIFVGPRTLASDVEMTRLVAHEIGHVICGEGHPDEGSGVAPLVGTIRLDRLMYSHISHKITAGTLYRNLLVKKEWDRAEDWMAEEERQGRMEQ